MIFPLVKVLEAFPPYVIELDGPDQGETTYQVRPNIIEKNEDDQSEHAPADPIRMLHGLSW